MKTHWKINTHGNPLGTLHNFIRAIWKQAELEGMLLPLNGTLEGSTRPHLVDDPARVDEVNPFKPLMTVNAAKLLPEVVRARPNANLGAMLRPCEMRALNEMIKHDSFKPERLLTISVDCLGTFPADEFQWRAERKGSAARLSQETLQFARQGGIVPYRYRSACQLCASPNAQAANVNIGILGVPVRQHFLVSTRDEITAVRLNLNSITDSLADIQLVQQRERAIAKMIERNQRTRQRVTSALADILPTDVGMLIRQFEECGTCQKCLESCPICEIDFPRRTEEGKLAPKDVIRWLISCAGCGMCEQSCPNSKPLCAIFGHIRQQLNEAFEYRPGHTLEDPLPV